MSLANLTEIQTAIQARGYGSDTATQQIDFVNARYREIFRERRWTWREATATGVTAVGNPVANLVAITDMDQRPDAVRLEVGTTYLELEYVEPEHFRRSEHVDRSNGVPEQWTYFAGQVRLYPRPDQVYTVDVDYFKKYTALVDGSSTILIPEEHRDVLVSGACADLAARERDWSARSAFLAEYEQQRNELRAADARPPRQTPARVQRSGFYVEDEAVDPLWLG